MTQGRFSDEGEKGLSLVVVLRENGLELCCIYSPGKYGNKSTVGNVAPESETHS